jgi:hypothetical protein
MLVMLQTGKYVVRKHGADRAQAIARAERPRREAQSMASRVSRAFPSPQGINTAQYAYRAGKTGLEPVRNGEMVLHVGSNGWRKGTGSIWGGGGQQSADRPSGPGLAVAFTCSWFPWGPLLDG